MPLTIKGTSLLDAVAAAKRREGERRYAEIIASLDPASRQVLSGVIVPTKYYPLDAFVNLLVGGFRLSGDDERLLIKRTEAAAEKQLTGVYRMFVRFGSPEFVIKRIATIHKTFFEGSEVNVVELKDGRAVIRYTGFRKEHYLIEFVQIGFYNKALEICGARDVVVQPSVPIAAGRAYSELTIIWRT